MDPVDYYSANAQEYAERNADTTLPDAYLAVRDRFLDALEEAVILDAGCGAGRDTAFFNEHGAHAVGVDAAQGMVVEARNRYGNHFQQGDLRHLPYRDDAFDGVWCNAAIFLLPYDDQPEALAELHRVLTDDGMMQISYKLGDGPHTVTEGTGSVTQYLASDEQVRRMLDDAGFDLAAAEVNAVGEKRFANYVCTL